MKNYRNSRNTGKKHCTMYIQSLLTLKSNHVEQQKLNLTSTHQLHVQYYVYMHDKRSLGFFFREFSQKMLLGQQISKHLSIGSSKTENRKQSMLIHFDVRAKQG